MTIKEIKTIINQSNVKDKDNILKIALKLEKIFFIHSLKIETLYLSKNEYNLNYINWLINKENKQFELFLNQFY